MTEVNRTGENDCGYTVADTYSPDDLAPPTVCDIGVPLPVAWDLARLLTRKKSLGFGAKGWDCEVEFFFLLAWGSYIEDTPAVGIPFRRITREGVMTMTIVTVVPSSRHINPCK